MLLHIESDVYYHETYEGPRLGTEYGSRVKTNRAACGRKVLKMHDNNNIPLFGGRTRKADGTVLPDWYDVKKYNWVCLLKNITNLND